MPARTAELKTKLEKVLMNINAQLPKSKPKPNPDYNPSKPSTERKGLRGNFASG